MKKQMLVLSLVLVLFCVGCSSTAEKGHKPVKKNFSGMSFYSEDPLAERQDTWVIEDGILKCTGTPKGYLYTNDSFRDFTVALDWRWPDPENPGKGGILIDMTGEHKIWPKSLEAQINAGDAGDFWALDGYKAKGAPARTDFMSHPQFGELTHIDKVQQAEKPAGQWNSYKIVAEGKTVLLFINDQIVNKATRKSTSGGKICITAEGTGIEFKNIKIEAD